MPSEIPPPAPIREIAGVTPERFRAEILPGYAPVVMRGLAGDWPLVAAARSTPQAAAAHLLAFDRGAAAEAFVGPPAIGGRFFYSPDLKGFNFERRRGSLAELLQFVLAIGDRADAPSVYAGAVETSETLPGLAEANPLPLVDGLGAVPRIWIGNATLVSPHFDASDNVAVVAAGRRRFTLFPPDQISNLYVGPLDHNVAGQPTSMVDPRAPDFDKFPRFRDALVAAQVAELDPGDAIYVPALWWHQVHALDSFNLLMNYWWVDSPDMAARFEAMVYAVLTISHLPEARRDAWSAMFDTFVFKRRGDPAAHLAPEHRSVLGPPTARLRQYVRAFLKRGLERP